MRPKRPTTGEPAAVLMPANQRHTPKDLAAVHKEPRATVGEPTWYPSPANPSLTPQNPRRPAGEPAELSESCTFQLRTPKGPAWCARGRGSPSKLRRPHPTVFNSDSGSPKQATASRRHLVLTKRRPSTPKSIGPSPSRSRNPLPASRPRFSRPQNRSRHPMNSSPVFWIIKPPSGAESGAGKPVPHSPSVESQIPDPKTGDPYPRSSLASPASRSDRTIPPKVEALPKAETLLPASWPQYLHSSSGCSHPEGRAQAAAWLATTPERAGHMPRAARSSSKGWSMISAETKHSPTGVPSEPTASCQKETRARSGAYPEGRASDASSPHPNSASRTGGVHSRTRSRQGPHTLRPPGEPVGAAH